MYIFVNFAAECNQIISVAAASSKIVDVPEQSFVPEPKLSTLPPRAEESATVVKSGWTREILRSESNV